MPSAEVEDVDAFTTCAARLCRNDPHLISAAKYLQGVEYVVYAGPDGNGGKISHAVFLFNVGADADPIKPAIALVDKQTGQPLAAN